MALDEHLETESGEGATNRRNGSSRKTMLRGACDPKLIAKYQRRFPDFDGKIVSMRARNERARDP